MSETPKDSGKQASGGGAGRKPQGRKQGYGSGRDQTAPPKGVDKDKDGGRDK